MKKTYFLGALALVLTLSFAVVSCSSDDNGGSGVSSITLKADNENETIGVDQTLTFTVEGSNGQDYTSSSQIMANGEAIDGNTFSFETGGEYIFTASHEDLTSNQLTYSVVSERFLEMSQSKALRSQEVTFSLINPDGSDATAEAEFYVNGEAVSGNTFSSDAEGSFEVYASYDEGISQTEEATLEVFIPKTKVSYEDYTGTWCGWCPRVTNSIKLIKEETDDAVIVAIHNGDAMQFAQEGSLRGEFGVSGFPTAKINRTQTMPYPEDGQMAINSLLNLAGEPNTMSIAIDTELNGDMLDVDVRVISEEDIPDGYKMVVYVTQNGLVFPQANYYNNEPSSPYYQMGAWISDFVHDDVLEASLTNIFGDNMGGVSAYQEFTAEFDAIDLSQYGHDDSNNSYDPNNFDVAVYIVNENNRTQNAQHVRAGERVDFE